MAVSVVQAAINDDSGVTQVSTTFAATPVEGNVLIAVVACSHQRELVLTDAGWSLALHDTGNERVRVWIKEAGASEPTTVTVQNAAADSVFLSLAIHEMEDVTTDVGNVSDAFRLTSVTQITAGPLTVSDPPRLLLAFVATEGTRAFSDAWTNGFTQVTDLRRLTTAMRVVESADDFDTTESWDTAANATAGLLALESTSGDPEPPTLEVPQNLQATVVSPTRVDLEWDGDPPDPPLEGFGARSEPNPVDHTTATHTIPLAMSTADGDSNMSSVQPGDVVAIESGSRGRLVLENFHGTAENPIVFVNDGGVVTITATGSQNAAIELFNCRYIRITGSGGDRHVGSQAWTPETGTDLSALEAAQNAGIVLTGTGDNRGIRFKDHDWLHEEDEGIHEIGLEFDHLEVGPLSKNGFHGPENAGTDPGDQYAITGLHFHHLYIHDTRMAPSHDGEGIYLGKNDGIGAIWHGDLEIAYCLVVRTGRQSLQFGGNWAGQSEIHHNVCKDPGQQIVEESGDPTSYQAFSCIIINHGGTGDVHSNVLINAARDGIRDQGAGGSRYWNNLLIRGNALGQGSSRGIRISSNRSVIGVFPGALAHVPEGTQAWNNTIVDMPDDGVFFTNDPNDANNEARNNLYVGGGDPTGTGGSASATTSNNLTASSAWFEDDTSDDYRLTDTAGAIDAGVSVPEFDRDLIDVPRPQGSDWDVGAYERTD